VKNSTSNNMVKASFKLKPTIVLAGQATAGAFMALAAAGTVFAQDAQQPAAKDASAAQTVVVTGIRKGIEDAISVKKNSDSIVEAISAEDIGKLPDVSVAESLSRLPGLAAQQSGGRAQQISIRGMSPDFGTGLLNGREQATTNDSRTTEFDQYPSELLSGGVVYKTPDAGLVGQGLSGTIDLQTVRPLNFSSRAVAVNVRHETLGKGQPAQGSGKRVSLSYVDQFADRKLGVALGFARLDDTTGVTSRFDNWGGGNFNGTNVPFSGFGVFADQTKQKRDGGAATIEFRPTKQFSSVLDVFYSKFDLVASTKGFQAPLADSWAGGTYDKGPTTLTNVTTDANGNVVKGTLNNVRAVIRNDATETKDKSVSLGWKNSLDLDGGLKLVADVAHSNAKRDQVILETYAGTTGTAAGPNLLDSITFDTSTGGHVFTPQLDYTNRSNIKLTDVQGWGGDVAQAGYIKQPHLRDNLNALRLDGKKDLGASGLTDVQFGLNFTNREKKREYDEAQLRIPGSDKFAYSDIPGSGTTVVGGIAIPVFDPVAAVNSGLYTLATKEHPDIWNKDWTVNEKITTAFVKSTVESTYGGMPVRGNIGVQFVEAKQSSTAYSVDKNSGTSDANRDVTNFTAGTSYHDVLPSSNFAFELADGQTLRLALARVMARPNMADMRASNGFGYDASKNILSGGGGNPNLEPFRANAIDLSYEKYFGTKAYVQAAMFYKRLSSYIINSTDTKFDFGPFVQSTLPDALHGNTVGEYTRPVNGHGGEIEGIELTASLPLNMVSNWLDGFGTQVSYSTNASSVSPPDLTGSSISTMPLPGLSKDVASYTVYFEKWGFGARFNRTTRSDYVGGITNSLGDHSLKFIKGEPVNAWQLSYDVQSGPMKGLGMQFQVNNANNAPYIEYNGPTYSPSKETTNQRYGKTVLFGLNYKL